MPSPISWRGHKKYLKVLFVAVATGAIGVTTIFRQYLLRTISIMDNKTQRDILYRCSEPIWYTSPVIIFGRIPHRKCPWFTLFTFL